MHNSIKCRMGIALVFILGCILPVSNTYFYIERSEAIHSKESVNGPPSIIYFEYNKIWLSTSIQPTFIQVGVHVPENQTVLLEDRTVELVQNIDNKNIKQELELIPVPGDARHVIPINYMLGYEHGFDPGENFGILTGGTIILNYPLAKNIICHKSYFFKIPYSVKNKTTGIIRFPNLRINGIIYPGPGLPFQEKKTTISTYIGP